MPRQLKIKKEKVFIDGCYNCLNLQYILLIFILVLLPICLSCSNDRKIDTKTQLDIFLNMISDFDIMERKVLLDPIDFSEKNKDRKYLMKGWSNGEKYHTWAEGLESSLKFIAFQDKRDIDITITCKPFTYEGAPVQWIKVYLNDKFIEKIRLINKLTDYVIHVPFQILSGNGENILKFCYNYAEKPMNHIDGSKDSRRLSVRFTMVHFGRKNDYNCFLRNNKIYQEIDTSLSYYTRVPKNTSLTFSMNNARQETVIGKVTIESEVSGRKSFEIKKSDHHEIDLADFENDLVKITFSAVNTNCDDQRLSSKNRASLEWTDIWLVRQSKCKEQVERKEVDINLNNISNKLANYDVIYIVLDALACKHSSAYDYPRKTTPTIDYLSNVGVLFENTIAAAPYTLASTASLFTSRYPFEHKLITNKDCLDPNLMTIAKILNDNNIMTYCIINHPWFYKHWGLDSDFQTVYYEPKIDFPIKKYLSKIYNDKIDKQRKFLYIHLLPPHEPYTPPQEYRIFNPNTADDFDMRKLWKIRRNEVSIQDDELKFLTDLYDANILYSDSFINQAISFLESEKLLDNIILIISSDHGEAFMEHGEQGHNSSVYEEMIHVPFVVKFPEKVKIINRRVKQQISLIDVAPSILDMMNCGYDANQFRGISFLSAIFGKSQDNASDYKNALISNREFIYSGTYEVSKSVTLRSNEYKYIRNKSGFEELYDLGEDSREKQNIIYESPIVSGYFRQELKRMLKVQKLSYMPRKNKVDFQKIDGKTLEQLKSLGYIR